MKMENQHVPFHNLVDFNSNLFFSIEFEFNSSCSIGNQLH